jgi:FdhE protein
MAVLVDEQKNFLSEFMADGLSRQLITEVQRHSTPIIRTLSLLREGAWHSVLYELLDKVEAKAELTVNLRDVFEDLRACDAFHLAGLADALFGMSYSEVDLAYAPFINGALQVAWSIMAGRLEPGAIPYLDSPGVCPVCGGQPVAGIARIGGQYQGHRYLHCGPCMAEWHVVRMKCSTCRSTKESHTTISRAVRGL